MKKKNIIVLGLIFIINSCNKKDVTKELKHNVDYLMIRDSIKKEVEADLIIEDSLKKDSILTSSKKLESDNFVIYKNSNGDKIKIFKDNLPPDLEGHDLTFYNDGEVYDQGAHSWVTDYILDFQAGCNH